MLPGRVPGYSPAMLDELTSAGEVVWAGAGSVGNGDGWLVLTPAESASLLLASPDELTMTPLHEAALSALDGGGGLFFRAISDRAAALTAGHPPEDGELVSALWDLVWAGLVTNDTLAPLRVLLGGGGQPRRLGRGAGRLVRWRLRRGARWRVAGAEPARPDSGPGASAGTASARPGYGTPRSAPGGVFNPRPGGRGYGSGGYGRGGYRARRLRPDGLRLAAPGHAVAHRPAERERALVLVARPGGAA